MHIIINYTDQPLSSCETLNSPHVVPFSGLTTGTQQPCELR